MPTTSTRRTVLKLIGGSVAGIFFTPLPWRLLGDAATWTQTGPLVTKNVRGNISIRHSTCTLCPAGCGVRAKSVAGVPFQLSPVAGHPLSGGTLCTAGLSGHYLAYHPLRLAHPLRMDEGHPVPVPEAEVRAAAIRAMGISGGTVAVLSTRRGGAINEAYAELLAGGKGTLCAPPETCSRLGDLFEEPSGPFGIDFGKTRVVLSAGTPLLDGWGNAARLRDGGCKIIQAESRRSRTATLADEWIPIAPGSDEAFALGIAHVLVREGLCDASGIAAAAADWENFRSSISAFPPERAARQTGIPAERIIALAHELTRESVVVAGGDPVPMAPGAERAYACLNLLLGNVGTRIVPLGKGRTPPVRSAGFADIADHSVKLLIIDASVADALIPPAVIAKTLCDGAVVVRLTPFAAGQAFAGEYRVPVAAQYEAFAEAGIPAGAIRESFGVGAPLIQGRPGDVDPFAWIAGLFGASRSTAEVLRARAAAIQAEGKGEVFRPESSGAMQPVTSFASADDLWNALAAGAVWMGEPPVGTAQRPLPRLRLLGPGATRQGTLPNDDNYPLTLVPFVDPGGYGRIAPLMTKIYQESALRTMTSIVILHPSTAGERGLADGDRALLETPAGSQEVSIRFDPACMPAALYAAAGPDPGEKPGTSVLALVPAGASWNAVPAQLRKVS